MNPNVNPAQNPPTVATLIVAFVSSLLTWAAAELDAPAAVEASGLALVLFFVAFYAGRFAQRFTDPKAQP